MRMVRVCIATYLVTCNKSAYHGLFLNSTRLLDYKGTDVSIYGEDGVWVSMFLTDLEDFLTD